MRISKQTSWYYVVLVITTLMAAYNLASAFVSDAFPYAAIAPCSTADQSPVYYARPSSSNAPISECCGIQRFRPFVGS